MQQERIIRHGGILPGGIIVGAMIGRGGFAEVYEGRDEKGNAVAIKALSSEAARYDEAAAERFVQEAQVALELRHPNIVRTFTCGHTQAGVLFIVMERLYGETLARRLYERPRRAIQAALLMAQILAALTEAHKAEIVHRDLKPSNVFLLPTEPTTTVKLLDFGFVKILDPSRARALTMTGQRVGTPGYMAPELLSQGIVSPLADLYTVGVLGYEMMTATPAFPGEGIERAFKQMQGKPAKPPREIAKSPLYKVIAKLLARNPKKRYQSAEEALAAVHDAVAKTRQ